MTVTDRTTIRDIVADDFRAAAVFHRNGIDFCCRGNRTIDDACAERGIDPDAVRGQVATACAAGQSGAPRFTTWDASTLIAYIVVNHHAYVRGTIPTLLAHTEKVARVHGERHPELVEIDRLFKGVAEEMTSHMFKEEKVLFPFIAAMEEAHRNGWAAPDAPFGDVDNPIRMMEMEHESAGDAMARIRQLSQGYQPPADACTTYRVCFRELEAFEIDLHSHVHLENNVLFPKARRTQHAARA